MYTVTLEDKGRDWVLGKIIQVVENMHRHPSEYPLEDVEMMQSLQSALEGGEHSRAPKPESNEPKKARKTPEAAVALRDGCEEHPNYGAKRRPRTDCDGCWNAFKSYNPASYSKARREFERKLRAESKV